MEKLSPDGAVVALDEKERARVAQAVEREQRKLRDALAALEDRQAFFSVITINTLRTWGRLPDAEMRCFFERGTDSLYVGRNDTERLRVELGASIDLSVPRLPARPGA